MAKLHLNGPNACETAGMGKPAAHILPTGQGFLSPGLQGLIVTVSLLRCVVRSD